MTIISCSRDDAEDNIFMFPFFCGVLLSVIPGIAIIRSENHRSLRLAHKIIRSTSCLRRVTS